MRKECIIKNSKTFLGNNNAKQHYDDLTCTTAEIAANEMGHFMYLPIGRPTTYLPHVEDQLKPLVV